MIEDLVCAIKSRSGFGSKSNKWKHWKATLDLKTCYECRTIHGKIYAINEPVSLCRHCTGAAAVKSRK